MPKNIKIFLLTFFAAFFILSGNSVVYAQPALDSVIGESPVITPDVGAKPVNPSAPNYIGNFNDPTACGDPKLEMINGICMPRRQCTQGSFTCVNNIQDLISLIIRTLLFLAGIIAVLFIIIGGFWYITSQGNEEQAEKGRNTLVNAVIGVVVILMAYVIVSVVSSTVTKNDTGATSGNGTGTNLPAQPTPRPPINEPTGGTDSGPMILD